MVEPDDKLAKKADWFAIGMHTALGVIVGVVLTFEHFIQIYSFSDWLAPDNHGFQLAAAFSLALGAFNARMGDRLWLRTDGLDRSRGYQHSAFSLRLCNWILWTSGGLAFALYLAPLVGIH